MSSNNTQQIVEHNTVAHVFHRSCLISQNKSDSDAYIHVNWNIFIVDMQVSRLAMLKI